MLKPDLFVLVKYPTACARFLGQTITAFVVSLFDAKHLFNGINTLGVRTVSQPLELVLDRRCDYEQGIALLVEFFDSVRLSVIELQFVLFHLILPLLLSLADNSASVLKAS